jgi:hypothetical protein
MSNPAYLVPEIRLTHPGRIWMSLPAEATLARPGHASIDSGIRLGLDLGAALLYATGHMKTITDHDGFARKTLPPTLRPKDVMTAEFLQENACDRCGRPLAEHAKFGVQWQRSSARLR